MATDSQAGRQADALPTRGRRRAVAVVWALCAASLAATLVGIAVRLASRPNIYRRYVSPPLHDGTRFTFVYPSYMVMPGPVTLKTPGLGGRTYTTTQAVATTRPGPLARLVSSSPWAWHVFGRLLTPHGADIEQVQILVSDDPRPSPSFVSGGTVVSKTGTYTRIDTPASFTHAGEHTITLRADGTGVECRFSHFYLGDGRRADFERDDNAVCTGFGVLPPGTPAPSP